LVEGDRVDLEKHPFADPNHDHPYFEFEFVEVAGADLETPGCLRVDFEGSPSAGFPPEHKIPVRKTDDDECGLIPAWIRGLRPGDTVLWNDQHKGLCSRS
jgi:hypothetical protein